MKLLKTKIFFSYLIVFVLLILIGYIVKNKVLSYKNNIVNDNSTIEVISQVNDILGKLYESESLSKTLQNKYRYKQIVNHKRLTDSIICKIDSLGNVLKNSGIKNNLDSIKILLLLKQSQIKKFLWFKSPNNIDSIYYHVKKKLNDKSDSVAVNLQVKENISTQYDSVYLKHKKAPEKTSFWSWLHSKNKTLAYDSTLHVTISRHLIKDSLINKVAKNDTIVNLLMNIISEFRDSIVHVELQQRVRENSIIDNNRTISAAIGKLVANIKDEQLNISYQQVSAQKERLSKTRYFLLYIGIIALCLIVFFLVNILRDITKTQRYRIDLEKAKNTIEEVLKTKELMMFSLSHDIRSPLHSIINNANTLAKGSCSVENKDYLDNISKQSRYIIQLLEDLLNMAKLEQGKLKFELRPFNFNKLLSEVIELHKSKAVSKNIEFQYSSEVEIDNNYYSDDLRLKQILNNIISNAIKYTEQGFIKVKVIIVNQNTTSDSIDIVVEDSGIGISNRQMKTLFEPFNRGTLRSNKYEGIGLGLSTTKHLVDMLNGDIKVISRIDRGSKFILSFNFKHAPKEISTEEISTSNYVKNLKNKTIWLVDDDKTVLNILAASLKSTQANICCYSNPIDAIKAYKPNCFDLLITDIQMPEMKGRELLQEINVINTKPVKAIAITGLDFNIPSEQDEFFAVIKKPFVQQQLMTAVYEAFEIKIERIINKANHGNGSLSPLLAFAVGDVELEKEIINSFFTNGENNINLFKVYLDNKDMMNIASLSHKLLNIYRQLKKKEIVKCLCDLENISEESFSEASYEIAKEAYEQLRFYIEFLKKEYGIS